MTIISIIIIKSGHCVNSIKNELSDLDGVQSVDGNPDSKSVSVEWDAPATLEGIKALLQEINYPAN